MRPWKQNKSFRSLRGDGLPQTMRVRHRDDVFYNAAISFSVPFASSVTLYCAQIVDPFLGSLSSLPSWVAMMATYYRYYRVAYVKGSVTFMPNSSVEAGTFGYVCMVNSAGSGDFIGATWDEMISYPSFRQKLLSRDKPTVIPFAMKLKDWLAAYHKSAWNTYPVDNAGVNAEYGIIGNTGAGGVTPIAPSITPSIIFGAFSSNIGISDIKARVSYYMTTDWMEPVPRLTTVNPD